MMAGAEPPCADRSSVLDLYCRQIKLVSDRIRAACPDLAGRLDVDGLYSYLFRRYLHGRLCWVTSAAVDAASSAL